MRAMRMRDGVVVTYERYRLTSEELRVVLPERGGVELEGPGRFALCPCSEPPVAFGFRRARITPDGDLTTTWPRVELHGVPIFALPWLWIRSPEHAGLLPPLLAWRGDDGLLVGSGVHLPWRARDGWPSALDLTAAGFTRGGVELGASAETRTTRSRVEWDHVAGDRLLVQGHGAVGDAWRGPSDGTALLAWDLDAIRGSHARSGTVELDPATRPFDTATAEGSTRGPLGRGVAALGGVGLAAYARRGLGPVAVGPVATSAIGGPLGRAGSWSALANGFVAAGDAVGDVALPTARASLDAELAPRVGPFALRLSTREIVRFAGRSTSFEPAASQPVAFDGSTTHDAVASGRATLGLPLVRSFDAGRDEAPLVHRIEPLVEMRGALAQRRGAFFTPIGGALAPASYVLDGGVTTALGRFGGAAGTLDLRAGALGDGARPLPLAHARLGVSAPVVGASVETAGTFAAAPGLAFVGRGRLGRADGLRLLAELAAQRGAGAREARAIADGAVAAVPGENLAYIALAGFWGGAGAVVPLSRAVVAKVHADADLAASVLLAVRGELGYRHPCGCFGVTLVGAHREGRGGFDMGLDVELAPR